MLRVAVGHPVPVGLRLHFELSIASQPFSIEGSEGHVDSPEDVWTQGQIAPRLAAGSVARTRHWLKRVIRRSCPRHNLHRRR